MTGVFLKNRVELANYFANLGFTRGAEIGVLYGRYSEILCQKIPGLKLLCIDNYPRKNANVYETAIQRLSPYKVEFITKSSVEAAKEVENESLDFVFIDANHSYESVKKDLSLWAQKVKTGGIVSGHDYYYSKTGNVGVVQAVNEYVKIHKIELNLTSKDKDNPTRDDRQPSWWFVKQPAQTNIIYNLHSAK